MRPVPDKPCMALIHAFEGKDGQHEATRTQDPGGLWEIGWSHRLSSPDDPLWDATLTRGDADTLALADLTDAAAELCTDVGDTPIGDLNDGQYAALIDFVYNEGIGQFKTSHLRALVAGGNLTLAYDEFPRWVYGTVDGQHVVLQGLVRRRAAEQDIWRAGNG